MKRTQIYLQDSQKKELERLAEQQGKALAEVVREAVDDYISDKKLTTRDALEQAYGLWKERTDISSVQYQDQLRADLNNRLEDMDK